MLPNLMASAQEKETASDAHGPTRSGVIMGTPSYMAPEQARGKIQEIGPPTDVYALGAILYDLLTGRPPFRADSPLDTLHQVISQPPRRPSTMRPDVPRELEAICLKCLEKDPAKRYPTAATLADDLHRFLHSGPRTNNPLLKRRLWPWAALLGVVVLLMVGFFVIRELTLQALQQIDSATATPRPQPMGTSLLPTAPPPVPSNPTGRSCGRFRNWRRRTRSIKSPSRHARSVMSLGARGSIEPTMPASPGKRPGRRRGRASGPSSSPMSYTAGSARIDSMRP